ncbi:anthranilate phosphoribosyltransferase [Shewanella marina]|uniref:anthranilate phosphoribosyltransferase n=1 Tax=Shewanella marina TaxID=487319 RepID=UPI0004713B94|nr:anthranilate phosphoribosyltransferase [Shewanella marina]
MVQQLLEKIYQGHSLSREQSKQLFEQLIAGNMQDVTISALLIALKLRGETIEEICGAADALRDNAKHFPKSSVTAEQGIVDIVGTGGDGFNTINISTTASFVAAAAGAKVAKHGNRSVSSQSGSSDLLAQCGIGLTPTPEHASECLDQLGLCFLFAPHYHSGVKHAVPVRQALKTRTLFNILGPLINPARPDFMLLGVYDEALVLPIAQVLQGLGIKRAMVVHGSGLDEIALHGHTSVAELNHTEINCYQLNPSDFGVAQAEIEKLKGGTPADNAIISQAILQGQSTAPQRDAVAINAAAALYLSGISPDLKSATQLALQVLDSGKAYQLMQRLAQATQTEEAAS